MKKLLLSLLLLALPLVAQTKLSLSQLPSCAITGATPSSTPIILAIVPTANGTSQFACFTLTGVSISTVNGAPAITIPTTITILPAFVNGEVPVGVVDGNNSSFTLANAPVIGSLDLYKNGLLMKAGLDYSLSGNTIIFLPAAIPTVADTLQASYQALI